MAIGEHGTEIGKRNISVFRPVITFRELDSTMRLLNINSCASCIPYLTPRASATLELSKQGEDQIADAITSPSSFLKSENCSKSPVSIGSPSNIYIKPNELWWRRLPFLASLCSERHGHGESGGVDLLILMSGATCLVDGGNNINLLVFKITLISCLPNAENN